ncbi:restriction endonuclease subunit S [Moritella viscosa]|uniref:Type I restriction-modification system specificity determinant XF2741 n=1 Tax=Moritella viscosa TaxID=80854 RepID=A0A1L0BHE1_9GAMM|nr:restriction endonuclease subunit S [Moritella viscosa]SGZ03456.1 Type I restriction-modification system specificity determinant XF2741 [Moritella viscosa]
MLLNEYMISEIATMKYGKMLSKSKFTKSGFPVYSGYKITGYTSEYLYEESEVIVVARGVGGTGDVKMSPPKSWVTNLSIVLSVDTEVVDKYYLCEMLNNDNLKAKLDSGASISQITINSLESYKIKLPTLDVQRSISRVLINYDNLIKNNNRRIAILEEMAQSIFDEWFVNFRYTGHDDNVDKDGNQKLIDSPVGQIPEGWEIKSAQNAITINPRTKLDKTSDNPFVGMSGLAVNSMVIGDVIQKQGNSGAKFINGDTLFARITPCLQNGKTGYVQYLTDSQPVGFGSTEFIVLRKSEYLSSEFIYLLSRSNNFREHAIQSMTGATGRQRVHNGCFASLYIAVPPRDLIDAFTDLVSPMFKSIFNLSKRNENIKKQRDMLLPKFISGEVEL